MKRLMKKVILIGGGLTMVSLFLSFAFCFPAFVFLLSLVVLLALCVSFDRMLCRSTMFWRFAKPVVYPTNDWYRKHHERNYECIILGDESAMNEHPECLHFNFSYKGQTLLWDYKILQNYFSILKKGGNAIFVITKSNQDSYNRNPKHKTLYYHGLSDYLLTTNDRDLKCLKLYKFFPLLWLSKYLLESLKFRPKCSGRYSNIEAFKTDVKTFCGLRNIDVSFKYI